MTSIVRQFVAVYGADAYERLAIRADSAETLAATLLRALEGPSAVPKECNEMSVLSGDTPGLPGSGISHIIVRWRANVPGAQEQQVCYDGTELGDTVARQRAASKVATVQAAGSAITRYRAYYLDNRVEDWLA